MAARRLHHLIYITIVNCCLILIVCGIAIGTTKWFSSSTNGAIEEVGKVETSYGLFNGVKTKDSIALVTHRYSLKLVCKGMNCMFSCGTTAEKRKQDIENILGGKEEEDYLLCTDTEDDDYDTLLGGDSSKANAIVKTSNEATISADADEDDERNKHFLNFGLYVSTLACLALGMIFALVSGILALYNTYRTPIQPILSVYGLYFWNGISASFVLLAMIMWLIEFMLYLRKNAAISETLSGIQDTSGKGSLGVSFWILILPILFALTNVAILKYRKWKIVKMEQTNVRVMQGEKEENGDTILF